MPLGAVLLALLLVFSGCSSGTASKVPATTSSSVSTTTSSEELCFKRMQEGIPCSKAQNISNWKKFLMSQEPDSYDTPMVCHRYADYVIERSNNDQTANHGSWICIPRYQHKFWCPEASKDDKGTSKDPDLTGLGCMFLGSEEDLAGKGDWVVDPCKTAWDEAEGKCEGLH